MSGHILLVFVIIAFLALLNKKWGLLISFALLIWMFSFRTNEIPDTEIYQWMYDDPISRLDYNEIGFLFLGLVFKEITGAEFIIYYLLIIGFCLILWFFAIKGLFHNKESIGMLFLLFVSFFGFFYMGITTRNFFSEILIFCALCSYIKGEKKVRFWMFLLFLILATVIHKSSIFFLFLLPLFKIKITSQTYSRIFVICVIIWLLSGTSMAKVIVGEISNISFFENYNKFSTSTESSPSLFSLQVLISWMVSFLAIKNEKYIKEDYKKVYDVFLKINLVGIVVMSIIWSLPTSYRFYNMFFFYNFIVLYLMCFQNRRIHKKYTPQIYATLVSIMYFVILIHSFPIMLLY